MGFDKNIEIQAINKLKQILKNTCDYEKANCLKLLIRYYYTRKARHSVQVIGYEQEFSILIEINKVNSMTSFEISETADVWLERLMVLDQYYN